MRELAAIKRGTLNEGLTEQGDVIAVLCADDAHGRLVEAQLASVRLQRAGDGTVR